MGEDGGVWQPLVASDGTIYWSSDTAGNMLRSEDNGETWEAVAPTGSEITVAPIELPDGRIASVSRRYVVVSDDQANTWKPVSPPLPFRARTLAYSPERKAFCILTRPAPTVKQTRCCASTSTTPPRKPRTPPRTRKPGELSEA